MCVCMRVCVCVCVCVCVYACVCVCSVKENIVARSAEFKCTYFYFNSCDNYLNIVF